MPLGAIEESPFPLAVANHHEVQSAMPKPVFVGGTKRLKENVPYFGTSNKALSTTGWAAAAPN